MIKGVSSFGRKAQDAEIALFFYAGHGMQVKGVNYLIPVGANVTNERDVEFEAMQADRVLSQMEGAGAKVNLVILGRLSRQSVQLVSFPDARFGGCARGDGQRHRLRHLAR